MATPIIVLMVTFTFVLIAGTWLYLERQLPRMMKARTDRNIATHASAVEALEIAVARTDNDPAQAARLAANLQVHRNALKALTS